MTGFLVDAGSLDEAFAAADRALATQDPTAARSTIAVNVTLAVLPAILDQVDDALQASARQLEQARQVNRQAREQVRTMADHARAQTTRLRRVFEEIDPDAIAEQMVHTLDARGYPLTDRDTRLIRGSISECLRRVTNAIGLSLAIDETKFNDL